MTKHKDDAKEMTPEELEALAQLEAYAKEEKAQAEADQTDGYAVAEPEPQRFTTGGATYDEIAAWRAAHAT